MVASWVLALALALGGAPPPTEDGVVNKALYDQAVERMGAHAYDEAAALFGELHRRTNDAWVLYNQAQAERLGGDCPAAIPLYRNFLELPEVDERDRFHARKNLKRCEADTGPIPSPTEGKALEPRSAESLPGTPAPPVETEKSVRDAPPSPKRWHAEPPPPPIPDGAPSGRRPLSRDPFAWSLVGAGGLAAIVGIPLYVSGVQTEQRDLEGAETEPQYVARVLRARKRKTAGGVLMVAASAAVLGAVARFVVLAVREKRSRDRVAARRR